MIKKESRNSMRVARHERIRKTLMGTCAMPRLCVFRSNKEIYAQIIDDETRTTLVSASSLDKDLKLSNGSNAEAAKVVGKAIAEKAKVPINAGTITAFLSCLLSKLRIVYFPYL